MKVQVKHRLNTFVVLQLAQLLVFLLNVWKVTNNVNSDSLSSYHGQPAPQPRLLGCPTHGRSTPKLILRFVYLKLIEADKRAGK
jgi:hypothetical protein